MLKDEKHEKLPKDVRKGDVFKLRKEKKNKVVYVTVTVQDVKQKSDKEALIVIYQHKSL